MDPSVRILHLRASNKYGGPEKQLHVHAQRLLGSDYDLTVASFTECGRAPCFLERLARDGIKTTLFRVRNAYDPRVVAIVRNFIDSNKVEILCTHDYRTHIIGFLASLHTRTKWIAFSRGWTKDTLRVRFYCLLDKIVTRFATHVVAVSHAQKQRLQRLLIPDRKISVVKNAISLKDDDPSYRRETPAPGSVRRIAAVGRLSREKGHDLLIEAVARIRSAAPPFRLHIYGCGPEEERLRKLAKTKGVVDIVEFKGMVEDILPVLREIDLLVLPSRSEGLPNIILEAWSQQLGVVAAAAGGVAEMIQSDTNGLLARPGDVGSLADQLLLAIANPDRMTALGRAGWESLEKNYSLEVQTQELTDIYRRFAENPCPDPFRDSERLSPTACDAVD